MSNENGQVKKGEVTVYCCGGAGMNIGTLLEAHAGQNEVGFANLRVVYVDTSKSNTRSHINENNSYILEGLDGSGKVRKENHQEISKHILAILQKFQSTDLNIVVSSTGGGSGSVIAPLIHSELLDRQLPVVCVGIGGVESTLAAQNTLKTLKSYESIAAMRNRPVAMYYVENDRIAERDQPDPRIASDKAVLGFVMAMCVLFSRENRELDSKDLYHFLDFEKVTSFRPQLVSMSVVEKTDVFDEDIGNVISVATLVQEGMSTHLPQTPDYQCTGFVSDQINSLFLAKIPVNFVISDGLIPAAAKHLNGILRDLENKGAARLRNQNILASNDQSTGDGLIV